MNVFQVSGQVEIQKDGQCFLNERRVLLLKLVAEKGSINAASKELKMSYQQAWNFIKEMNEVSPLPLVIRQRGGVNGGGAQITKFGLKAIRNFEEVKRGYAEINQKASRSLWFCSFDG